jgi:D-arabinose 1-dehydrogenase-like Zn-dependent alcohol dehydrogenase
VELGSNVSEHIQNGNIIDVSVIQKTCLRCEYCLTGRETLGESARVSDVSDNGC